MTPSRMKHFFSLFVPDKAALIAFALGAAMVFAHAPIAVQPLALVALAGLFWFGQKRKPSWKPLASDCGSVSVTLALASVG